MNKYLALVLILILFISCSTSITGNFWMNFRKNEIVFNKNDHGGWGGETEIHWSKKSNLYFFEKQEIIQFANSNDWKFVDESPGSKINTANDFSFTILKEKFSINELSDSTILRFKSDLLTINEDENLSTQKNCFAIINKKKNKLVIYYRWGNF